MTNSAPVYTPINRPFLAPFYPIRVRIDPWASTPSPPPSQGGEVLWIALCAKSKTFDPRVYWAVGHQPVSG